MLREYVRHSFVTLLMVSGLFLIVGCGDSTLDSKKAESAILQGVAAQTGAKVKAVSCPENVKPKQGNVFACTLKGNDNTVASVKVLQTDNHGHVTYQVKLVKQDYVEQSIEDYVENKTSGVVSSVNCPDIVLLVKGYKFNCEIVSLKGEQAPVGIVLLNDHGGFSINLTVEQKRPR